MKHLFFIAALWLTGNVSAQFITIPDPEFRKQLRAWYPTCFNEKMELDTTCDDMLKTTYLNVDYQQFIDMTGIEYFKNLRELKCSHGKLKVLPKLPNSIREAYFNYDSITTMVRLPSRLIILEIRGNKLKEIDISYSSVRALSCGGSTLEKLHLPKKMARLECIASEKIAFRSFPDSLNSLVVVRCGWSALPKLPSTLERLNCENNQLFSLPTLPPALIQLNCGNNQLTQLPVLPKKLQRLDCARNELAKLPVLPKSLIVLNCFNNQLTNLPTLPDSLKILDCTYNQLVRIENIPPKLIKCEIAGKSLQSLPVFPLGTPLSDRDNSLFYYDVLQDTDEMEKEEVYLSDMPSETNTRQRLVIGDIFNFFDDTIEFYEYVQLNMKPQQAFNPSGYKDHVIVQFTIDANKRVGNIKILQGKYKNLNAEAIRIVESSHGKWLVPGPPQSKAILNRLIVFK